LQKKKNFSETESLFEEFESLVGAVHTAYPMTGEPTIRRNSTLKKNK